MEEEEKRARAELEAFGLADVAQIFTSAIEISEYEEHPDGGWWDGPRFILALIARAEKRGRESSEPQP